MEPYQDRIRKIRAGLSPSYTRLADFLLDSYVEAAFLTATELAHQLDIDPATVVRFAQKLGHPGYPDLQREIRGRVMREWLHKPAEDSAASDTPAQEALGDLAHILQLTQRSLATQPLEKLIAALDECERVIILAEGAARPAAGILAGRLAVSGSAVLFPQASPAELAQALETGRKKDLALALEASPDSPIIERAMERARKRGMRTVALVAAPSAPAARQAEYVLEAHASPAPDVRQMALTALVLALLRQLSAARPGRFRRPEDRLLDVSNLLAGESRPRS
jgi:DNA-binding MurR/RpiR family transcriptional regulator